MQALNIQAAAGKDRPEYAASLNDLGRLYEAMGNNRHAEALYQAALGIRVRMLGEGHPDSAQSMNDLGALHETLGRRAEAEGLSERPWRSAARRWARGIPITPRA